MQILGAAVNLKLAVVKGSTQVYLGWIKKKYW